MSESYHYRRIPKPPPEVKAQEKTRGRNTKRNLTLVILGLGYSLYTHDVPLLIAAVSILLFFLQPLAEKYLGSFGKATSGFLRGIGIALFIGAIAMLFL
ncbi:hypothetical protein [Selenomonas sp. CM52]|uniref:hypothetical protein n=1 Tax=Selenomonas sp. CM52 TaxID=936381 RepID=UPI00027C5775|nr:hypothetical protein [Selenomonas sp. CM52]EJU28480.1 hypothetical protein HMPREF1153_0926 [Selenomonas sp. CM52]